MLTYIERFFSDTFMPHGYCFQWRPDILWTNVVSDFLIAVAYFSIPVALVILVRKRQDMQFKGIFVLFAMFILLCGITHLMGIYTMWHASYGLHGLLKAMTAIVSMATAFVVFKNLNQALAIPSIDQLREAENESARQRLKSERLEIERKADAIFRFTTELIPTGLLVVDAEQHIVMANEALANIFGYDKHELEGRPLNQLLESRMTHHSSLVNKYLEKPEQFHSMAEGRVVRGRHKNGHSIDIQINLAVHEYKSEKHAFASVTDFGSFIFEQSQFNELSNRLQRAIDASNDGIWEWRVQTGEVWYSPQLMKLIGRDENEKPSFEIWRDHIHPKDWPNVEAAINKHFEDKGKYDISYRGRAENGQYEWFHTRGNTLFDEQGNAILMSGTLSNINATRELEDRLEEQTQFLEQVLDRSLTGMYLFDLEQQKNIYINPEYTHLTGYTMKELEQAQSEDTLLPLFHPEDQEAINQHFAEVLADKREQGVGIEYRFRHKDGSWRWFYSRDSVYSYHKDGKPQKMLGSFFDITELKNREQEIRRLARDYSTTFEQAGVGIAHVSMDGRFIKVNAKLKEMLEYDEDALQNMPFIEITHPEDRDRGQDALRQFRMGEISHYEAEKRYISRTGRAIWAHLTVSIVTGESTTTPYLICIIDDISSRKVMENKLSESNTALERFAYSASHDLQEPVRKISAFTGALERRLEGQIQDEETASLLGRITDAATRMGDMIDNLLQLSRATRAPLDYTSVYLSGLLAVAMDDLSSRLSQLDARIYLKQDLKLTLDPKAFNQVIRNLLSNSINYRKPDQPLNIEIMTYQKENICVVELSDNGIGIDTDKADKIFEPFKRLVGRDKPGTGMGLAICRQIVNAHGGRIYATGQPDQGLTVTIELPMNGKSEMQENAG